MLKLTWATAEIRLPQVLLQSRTDSRTPTWANRYTISQAASAGTLEGWNDFSTPFISSAHDILSGQVYADGGYEA